MSRNGVSSVLAQRTYGRPPLRVIGCGRPGPGSRRAERCYHGTPSGVYCPSLLPTGMLDREGRHAHGYRFPSRRGSLAEEKAEFPNTATHKRHLQGLSLSQEFDAVICVDAMEFVPPEDWPFVLGVFRRHLKRTAIGTC